MSESLRFDDESGLILPEQYVTETGHVCIPVESFKKLVHASKFASKLSSLYDDGVRGEELEMEISGLLGLLEKWNREVGE